MILDTKLASLIVRKSRDKKKFGDQRMELYQTWQLAEISDIDGAVMKGRQGFSTQGAMDSGIRIGAGEERNGINDLNITYRLPKNSMVHLDIHHWESDEAKSTRAVRSVFTDETLKLLAKAWDEASKDERLAKKGLNDWVEKNAPKIIEAGVGAISLVAAGIISTFDMKPLFSSLLNLAKHNADDYLGMSRFLIQTYPNNTWRVKSPVAGLTQRSNSEDPLMVFDTIRSPTGSIDYDVIFEMSVLQM